MTEMGRGEGTAMAEVLVGRTTHRGLGTHGLVGTRETMQSALSPFPRAASPTMPSRGVSGASLTRRCSVKS